MPKVKLDENLVAENIKEIIEKLAISATIEVSRIEKTFFIDISSEDSALLIGKHGINLDSLQFILSVRLKTITGDDDFEVFVDVGNWRRQKEERLKQVAFSVAQKVAQSKTPEALYNLKANERRVIHLALTGHLEVETLSEGEGIDRHLMIKPK
ncbi:KH domain-containing protein [Candidatus Curtissbacteria bacterium]|nr:KH domain-containing protein [Candidatus Curtissbacteria bacterium]